MPPWINKFYILDLKPENSFIKWATEQGYTVFVVSWVNPDEQLTSLVFEDYMKLGPLAALDAIEQATGEKKVTAIGYCIGGTLLATTLAYMAARGDDRIAACTFFTAQVDFTEPGELGVFIDEDQLASVEEMMSKKGYLEGSEMATTFNMLRANDLIWSFVVNNYLMGKDPFPFDLLFWNADATRMPAAMHSYYLRNMYQKNLLVKPGGLVHRQRADRPAQDHDPGLPAGRQGRPHRARQVGLQGDADLQRAGALHAGGSGHIAGVVNPPRNKKYQHWLNETAKNPPTLDEWRAGAQEYPGLVVARLGQVAVGQVRPEGPGARAGRRRPARDRGRAGQLREGAHDRLTGGRAFSPAHEAGQTSPAARLCPASFDSASPPVDLNARLPTSAEDRPRTGP